VTADPATARRQARILVAALAETGNDELALSGVDLMPALEQQLFFALRDGRAAPSGGRALASRALEAVRPVGAAALGLAAWQLPSPGEGPIVVLVRDPTHYPVLHQIEAELHSSGGEALALVRVGRAAGVAPDHAIAPSLAETLHPRLAIAAAGHRRAVAAAVRRASADWSALVGTDRAGELRRIAVVEAGRIALGAAGLLSVVRRWHPALLAAFDEIGTWARILPAVARSAGIPSLDLPHAEAADAEAIRGAAYDVMATYGPRATAVLRQADVPAERIVEIGAPRFDPLVAVAEARGGLEAAAEERRVVFAAQYVAGAMTRPALLACYRAALAAAEALDAALVVVPHPAEETGTAAGLVAEGGPREAVEVRIAEAGDLHRQLVGAELLVTGWSNSVFEAAVAGVPALTVDPGGIAPVDFAADGLSLGASDAAAAAAAAAKLRHQRERQAAVDRARRVAEERLGALDGQASARAARLMLSLARGEPWRSAA
jgi:hypothetical protein